MHEYRQSDSSYSGFYHVCSLIILTDHGKGTWFLRAVYKDVPTAVHSERFPSFSCNFLPAFYASLSNLILSCFALSFNSYQIHYLVKAPTKLLDFTSLQLICGCSFAAFPLVCLRYPSPFSVLFS